MVGKHCVICDGPLSMAEKELTLLLQFHLVPLVTQIKHSDLRKGAGFMHASPFSRQSFWKSDMYETDRWVDRPDNGAQTLDTQAFTVSKVSPAHNPPANQTPSMHFTWKRSMFLLWTLRHDGGPRLTRRDTVPGTSHIYSRGNNQAGGEK